MASETLGSVETMGVDHVFPQISVSPGMPQGRQLRNYRKPREVPLKTRTVSREPAQTDPGRLRLRQRCHVDGEAQTSTEERLRWRPAAYTLPTWMRARHGVPCSGVHVPHREGTLLPVAASTKKPKRAPAWVRPE